MKFGEIMTIGKACGKIILFGEHFVVHGISAIAAGISNYCKISLTKSDENLFIGPEGTNQEISKKSVSNILAAIGVKENYKITYGGNLQIFGGLGSSAAFCVAIVRALAKEHKLKLRNEQINAYAYEGEKAFHGNPSGIDNTMVTYGGVMLYYRGATFAENKFEQIKIGAPLHVVLGLTGIFSQTVVMISKVKDFKEKNQVEFKKLADKMKGIITEARIAIEKGNLKKIGELMDENQKLLGALGVSIDVNEKLISAMKNAGALGAKITGGGGGGYCIALANDKKHANKILKAIEKDGFDGFCTEIR